MKISIALNAATITILGFIYPVALTLIILGLFHKYIGKYVCIYPVTIVIVAAFSAIDIFNKNVMMNQWTSVLKYIPFYTEGVGWIVPAIIGAHIGVIKVLRENDIPIHLIAGSSMGALVGTFYAASSNVERLYKLANVFKRKYYLDFTVPKMGFIICKHFNHIFDTFTSNKPHFRNR
ncbi:branched-chain amino acid transport system II carrier protein, partial [Bacillus sp. D-CC]